MIFSLYVSNIEYAKVYIDDEKISHLKLNIHENEFEDIKELSKEDNKYYKDLSNIDILDISNKLPTYKKDFSRRQNKIITSYNETYSKYNNHTYVQRKVVMPLDIIIINNEIIGFIKTNSSNTSVLVKEGYEKYTPLSLWENYDKTIYKVDTKKEYMVKMRDGISLSTLVYLPRGTSQKLPTILIRTPYTKEETINRYIPFVQRGYAVVIQDVRGRNKSEGIFDPHLNEADDGCDTLNWIGESPWSNEKVGMIGGSYLGYVQWAAASTKNKYLKALISIVTSGSPFVDIPRKGGSFTSGVMAWAFLVSKKQADKDCMNRNDWDEILNIRPLKDIPKKALGYEIDFFNRWLENKDLDEYWQKQSWHYKKDDISVPAMIVSGWFDDNGAATTEALDVVYNYQSYNKKIILGPWMHKANTTRDIHNVEFGDNAIRYDLDYKYFLWFDNKLKGIQNNIDKEKTVEYYTTGDNKWKTTGTWPIKNTINRELYLSSKGKANTSGGDGKLLYNIKEESKDIYEYDPLNPSIHIIDMSENEISVPENYKEVEKRDDMVLYTTYALNKDLTVTGEVEVEFYAGSDKVDTDFIVRILDVDENNNSIKLSDGILTARYRNGFDKSEFMEIGEVYKFNIKTSKLSHTFKKGHRIRLSITSSAKNYIFPHSNTINGYDSEVYEVATNIIYHGDKYKSKIVLPIEI